MPKEIANPQAVYTSEVNEPRIVGEVIIDNLANSSEQPFGSIRQQLASGNLPTLAQHLVSVASYLREKPIPCSDIKTKAKS